MVQKSGTGVPIQQYLSHDAYLHAVSAALAAELGAGGGATKAVMRWSNVSDRTARNWLGAEKAPGGHHLIMLARHSPMVWRSIQELSGHQYVAIADDIHAAEVALSRALGIIERLKRPRVTS